MPQNTYSLPSERPTISRRVVTEHRDADGQTIMYTVDELDGDGGTAYLETVAEAEADKEEADAAFMVYSATLEPRIGREVVDELQRLAETWATTERTDAAARIYEVFSYLWGLEGGDMLYGPGSRPRRGRLPLDAGDDGLPADDDLSDEPSPA